MFEIIVVESQGIILMAGVLSMVSRSVDGCTFADPCRMNGNDPVECPDAAQTCNWVFPYCTKHVCPPVATCSDPCQDWKCENAEEACVAVAENCHEPLCKIKPQCNARVRPGVCPDEPKFLSSCASQCQDDHLCPKNYKCCKGFCIPPIL